MLLGSMIHEYFEDKTGDYDGIDVRADAPQDVCIACIEFNNKDATVYEIDNKEYWCHTDEYKEYVLRKCGNKIPATSVVICD